MKILSLCFCNDYFTEHPFVNVENDLIDIKLNKNIFDVDLDLGQNYNLILAAPPCDIFTKAGSSYWTDVLSIKEMQFVAIANRCLEICIRSGQNWVLENPPGRIEKLIPALKKFRQITFQDKYSNKEYVLYSNKLLLVETTKRYGKKVNIHSWDKAKREMWTTGLIELINYNFISGFNGW